MGIEGHMPKKREVAVARIVSLVIMFFNPTRDSLETIFHSIHNTPGHTRNNILSIFAMGSTEGSKQAASRAVYWPLRGTCKLPQQSHILFLFPGPRKLVA